jgi:hypothetical protein
MEEGLAATETAETEAVPALAAAVLMVAEPD